MMETIRTRRVIIHELPGLPRPWRASDLLYGTVRYYKTAANALKGVKRFGAKESHEGRSWITQIEWQPTTHRGKAVVDAITKE